MFGRKKTKLQKDLDILEEMAEDLSNYLRTDALFGPMGPNRPKMTLGGYLMREHRLLALQGNLSQPEKNRLLKARQTFENTVMEWVVATEKKAVQEIEARMRQWQETIRDLRENAVKHWPYYHTAVEARVMLALLLKLLSSPPFKANEELANRLAVLDQALFVAWYSDARAFVWDEDWASAYPAAEFEFLYGKPRNSGIQ